MQGRAWREYSGGLKEPGKTYTLETINLAAGKNLIFPRIIEMSQSVEALRWGSPPLISRIAIKVHSLWMAWTYPFVHVGKKFSAHYRCDIRRSLARQIKIGNSVIIDCDVWFNVPVAPNHNDPVIVIGDGCRIGRRCVVSAKNRIDIERGAIFGPSVLVMDHNHAFEDVTIPIAEQGITEGGTIRIEEGAWIGFGAAIVCSKGELVIGRNSIVGANSVVTRSVPPFSIVSGNPGRVVKQFDSSKGKWTLGSVGRAIQHEENQK